MNADRAGSPIQSAGNAPSVVSVDVTVIYDSKDGRVAHLHHVITADGATRRTAEDQQRSAREAAARLGVEVDGLELLHLPGFRGTGGKAYRVDVAARKLVELPTQTRTDRELPPDSAGSGM